MFAEARASITKGLVALVALGLVVVLFTARVPGPLAIALGFVATLVCAASVVSLVEAPASTERAAALEIRAIGGPLLALAVALALVQTGLVLAVAGVLGNVGAAIVCTGTFLFATIMAYRLADRVRGISGRPLWARYSFVAIVLQVLVTLPLLGAFGLTDPWETHYGEVAREMVARHDPMSPFWAHEGFFRTKPVLDFWIQALSFQATNVHCASGQMLVGLFGHVARPEWAARYPIFVMALVGNVTLGFGVARTFGKRAGFFAQLVLATTAHFALLGHQSITDMPLVSSVMTSIGLWLVSRATPEGARPFVARLGIGKWEVVLTSSRLVAGLFLVLLVPQIGLLVSRNIDVSMQGALIHADRVISGSAGNEHLPGQVARVVERIAFPKVWPVHQGLAWAFLGILVASVIVSIRDARALAITAAFVVCAPGTLAKGPAGFVFLSAVVVVVWLMDERSVSIDKLGPYAIGVFALAILVVPWFLAMHLRHGRAFTDELVMRHMIGRTLEHLHDTNEGEDTSARYYLWQLGYGLFPWTGLVPAALSTWGRPHDGPVREKARLGLVAWALVAFALVTVMKTKFHHYVFPAVPPIAVLVGVELSRLFGEPGGRDRTARGALAVVGGILTLAVGADFFAGPESYPGHGQARFMHLFTYMYRRSWPSNVDLRIPLLVLTVVATVCTLGLAARRGRRILAGAVSASAFVFTLFLLDVYLVRAAPHWGQRELVAAWMAKPDRGAEPLIAWNMNWKGENFYAGNHVAIFLNGHAQLPAYLAGKRKEGRGVLYAVCEHSRVSELRAATRGETTWEVTPLTTAAQNDKFVLVELRAAAAPSTR